MMDHIDTRNAIVAGFILTILTLPFPSRVVTCLRTKLVPEKELISPAEARKRRDDESQPVDNTNSKIKEASAVKRRVDDDDEEDEIPYT